MKIRGVDGLPAGLIEAEVQQGAKFVLYQYCVSVLILTFKRPSDIYYIRPGQSAFVKGLPFTLLSLIAGWWGIPWGPIYTIQALVVNSGGGKDVTPEILASFRGGA